MAHPFSEKGSFAKNYPGWGVKIFKGIQLTIQKVSMQNRRIKQLLGPAHQRCSEMRRGSRNQYGLRVCVQNLSLQSKKEQQW
jgi:hypothetical protein